MRNPERACRDGCPAPAGANPAGVDVGKRAVGPGRLVDPAAAGELGVHPLDPLHRGDYHSRIPGVDAPVVIEVVHASVTVVVDEDVRGVAELVAAVLRPPTAPADTLLVVLGGAEAGHHPHVLDPHPVRLEIFDHELQLVNQGFPEDHVLRPDVLLVVGQEVAQPEVLGDLEVLILGGDDDEAVGILVGV